MGEKTREETVEDWFLPRPLSRKIFFAKDVNLETIEKISEDIILINTNDRYLEKLYYIHDIIYEPKPIEIYIDSYGGYIYQVMGLLSIMEKSITPIHTIVTGAAMSCGFMMLIFGHKRFAYENATLMYHQVSTDFDGKIKDMEELYSETKRLQNKFEEMTIRKTKISKDQLDNIREKKIDWYFTTTEARDLGIIDETI